MRRPAAPCLALLLCAAAALPAVSADVPTPESVLGFSVLRTTMRRTSEVLKLLVRAESEPPATPAQSPARSPAPKPDTSAVRARVAAPTRLKQHLAQASRKSTSSTKPFPAS